MRSTSLGSLIFRQTKSQRFCMPDFGREGVATECTEIREREARRIALSRKKNRTLRLRAGWFLLRAVVIPTRDEIQSDIRPPRMIDFFPTRNRSGPPVPQYWLRIL